MTHVLQRHRTLVYEAYAAGKSYEAIAAAVFAVSGCAISYTNVGGWIFRECESGRLPRRADRTKVLSSPLRAPAIEAEIRRLYAADATQRQIASAVAPMLDKPLTGGAISGFLAREFADGTLTRRPPRPARGRKPKPKPERKPAQKLEPAPKPEPKPTPFAHLRAACCTWLTEQPTASGGARRWLNCDAPAVRGKPFCAEHGKLAYTPRNGSASALRRSNWTF